MFEHLISGARVLRFDEEYNSVEVALKTIASYLHVGSGQQQLAEAFDDRIE